MNKPKSISSSRGKPLVDKKIKKVPAKVHEADSGDRADSAFNNIRNKINELNAEAGLLNTPERAGPTKLRRD